ncbi:MAG: transglycosylase SLT domain-containing protein [Anaerolineales bacterium]|nr:transglycosylase SLT domain-containing protein [Anaerolineales bacterium]
MKKLRFWLVISSLLWFIWLFSAYFNPVFAAVPRLYQMDATAKRETFLSTYWPQSIQRWASLIYKVSYVHGIDPDLVAAVIMAESNGNPAGISRMGAVGLMGVMPQAPGLEWRPTTEELTDPSTNLRWGVAILSDIIQQSGGDVYAALAAYNGGWPNADRSIPQRYAADVLDDYGRAIITRTGGSPDIAAQWTLAIEMRRGNIPTESLLILGEQPISGLKVYGEHVLYDFVNEEGDAFFIKGYAVPIALIVPEFATETPLYKSSDSLEPALSMRLGLLDSKADARNPRVMLTCLATSSRLRGQENTRWFAPSSCPEWRRP